MKKVKKRMKKMPDSVKKNLALLLRAMDSSSCSICIADAAKPDFPLIYVNETFETITGYKASEAVGQNCRFLQGKDRKQPELKKIRKALTAKKPCTVILKNYRKSGELFWNELQIAPVFDDKNKLTHYIGIQTDVTDRVKTEKILVDYKNELEQQVQQRTAELREKNSALKQILGQIESEKHEIKEQIVSNIERLIIPMIKKMKGKSSSSSQDKYLNLLEQNLNQLTSGFGLQITKKFYRLTPREIEVADMIRNGFTTKDIASALNVSTDTVENQRNSIRKKLDISKKKVNLVSYLQQLS